MLYVISAFSPSSLSVASTYIIQHRSVEFFQVVDMKFSFFFRFFFFNAKQVAENKIAFY